MWCLMCWRQWWSPEYGNRFLLNVSAYVLWYIGSDVERSQEKRTEFCLWNVRWGNSVEVVGRSGRKTLKWITENVDLRQNEVSNDKSNEWVFEIIAVNIRDPRKGVCLSVGWPLALQDLRFPWRWIFLLWLQGYGVTPCSLAGNTLFPHKYARCLHIIIIHPKDRERDTCRPK